MSKKDKPPSDTGLQRQELHRMLGGIDPVHFPAVREFLTSLRRPHQTKSVTPQEASNTLPPANPPQRKKGATKFCSCGGSNENCYRCSGTGVLAQKEVIRAGRRTTYPFCPVCKRQFNSIDKRDHHVRTNACKKPVEAVKTKNSNVVSKPSTKGPVRCQWCEDVVSADHLQTHLNQRHQNVKCPRCPLRFTLDKIEKHIHLAHPTNTIARPSTTHGKNAIISATNGERWYQGRRESSGRFTSSPLKDDYGENSGPDDYGQKSGPDPWDKYR